MANDLTRQQRWRQKNPSRYRAHLAVAVALRDGRLEKQPCEVCGTLKNVDAHHPRYDRPLEVQWLCRRHHVQLHRRAGE